MTGLAADSGLAGGSNRGWARRAASVVTMVAGAAAGGWLLKYSLALPLALCGTVSGVCAVAAYRSEEHTSELQTQSNLVCRLLLEKKRRSCYGPFQPSARSWARACR